MHQRFNPLDWLPNDEGDDNQPFNNQPPNNQPSNDIDLIVSRIEASHMDITGSYADWLNLGFALADELGEGGRDYFHRISRFYPKYSYMDCNKQFDQCLKSTGHGITIKTLFHLAKQAGIELGAKGVEHGATSMGQRARGVEQEARSQEQEASEPQAPSSEPPAPDLPTLPDSIFPSLPDFLKRVVEVAESKEVRDILLLGTLGAVSACLHKMSGIYDRNQVYPNLYLYITAQASAGKGRLAHCKRLIMPVHWALRKESQQLKQAYEMAMRDYNLAKGKGCEVEKPVKPPEKLLIIPANSSATGVFELLAENEGRGLIYETEGDTMAQALKSDYGNYSDGLRKGTHHEMISYYRRTDREYKEIEEPCISVVMTGTPKQVFALIPSAENGLLSRFIFYRMNISPGWKDVFASGDDNSLKDHFNKLGQEFFSLHKALNENPSIQFCMTQDQHTEFNAFFSQIQEKYLMLQGVDYIATVRRMGLIAFRIAMIFNALRILESGDFSQKQYCSEDDFQNTLAMIRILVKHSSQVFSELPADEKPVKPKDRKEQFLDSLPERFTRPIYLEMAKRLEIHEKSANRYINEFCDKGYIFRESQGVYRNLSLEQKNRENGEEGK